MFAHIIILVAARQLESLFQIHQLLRRVPLKQHFQRIQYIFGHLAFDFSKDGIRVINDAIRCLTIASSVRYHLRRQMAYIANIGPWEQLSTKGVLIDHGNPSSKSILLR
jgi:hypothetical protein